MASTPPTMAPTNSHNLQDRILFKLIEIQYLLDRSVKYDPALTACYHRN
jgi:hypothetical protein